MSSTENVHHVRKNGPFLCTQRCGGAARGCQKRFVHLKHKMSSNEKAYHVTKNGPFPCTQRRGRAAHALPPLSRLNSSSCFLPLSAFTHSTCRAHGDSQRHASGPRASVATIARVLTITTGLNRSQNQFDEESKTDFHISLRSLKT